MLLWVLPVIFTSHTEAAIVIISLLFSSLLHPGNLIPLTPSVSNVLYTVVVRIQHYFRLNIEGRCRRSRRNRAPIIMMLSVRECRCVVTATIWFFVRFCFSFNLFCFVLFFAFLVSVASLSFASLRFISVVVVVVALMYCCTVLFRKPPLPPLPPSI